MEWYREAGGAVQSEKFNGFTRKIFVPNTAEAEVEIKNKFDCKDCYMTVFSYESQPQQESRMIGNFYMDFDLKISDANDYEKIKNDLIFAINIFKNDFGIESKDLDIYFSGNKGFHLMVSPVMLGVVPKKNLNEDYKLLARAIKSRVMNKTIDTVVYDTVRLIRLNNTINTKSGLYKVKVTEKMVRNFTLERMREYASKPRDEDINRVRFPTEKSIRAYKSFIAERISLDRSKNAEAMKRKTKSKFDTSDLLPCLAYILDSRFSKGNRNNVAILLASGLFQCKNDIEGVEDVLTEWNSKNDEMLDMKEISSIVLSASRQIQEGKTYGCKKAREQSKCIGSLCKLYKGKN